MDNSNSNLIAAPNTQDTKLITEISQSYLRAATSDNTRRAYQSDIRHFIRWGGFLPANIELLQRYLSEFADKLNPRTLVRRFTAIKQWHVYQGFSDPTSNPMLRKLLTGIKNVHGTPKEKAPPLTLDALEKMIKCLEKSGSLMDARNNALLQIGFFGAFRRSELVAIKWEYIQFLPEGIEILLPRSKTDQAGEGQVCAIPYGKGRLCSVKALKMWQEKSGLSSGPVFCRLPIDEKNTAAIKPGQVNYIFKTIAKKSGLPNPMGYSSHSARRGFATEASKKGAPFGSIMRQGRWRHEGTVLGYIDEGKRFDNNAVDVMLQHHQNNTESIDDDKQQ